MIDSVILLAPLWTPLAAVALDMAIGDPPALPHPVRAIGKAAAWMEPRLRPIAGPFFAGVLGLLFMLCATSAVVCPLLLLPGVWALLPCVYLACAGLALGQLLREGRRALAFISRNDSENARRAVGSLVSRDVRKADMNELCRVLAETMSENINDAFIAPFFWLATGGPLGLWLYKTVSTLDSMWGYPYPPWTQFGAAAARADDMLAYIPARLTALFLLAAAFPFGLHKNWPGFAVIQRQAASMKSPNAGWPMSVCAWLHHAHMGGHAVYDGKPTEKPRLGPQDAAWDIAKINTLLTHLRLTGILAAVMLWLCLTVPLFLLL